MTIELVPANTNAKVPTNSAKYFFMEFRVEGMDRPLHTLLFRALAYSLHGQHGPTGHNGQHIIPPFPRQQVMPGYRARHSGPSQSARLRTSSESAAADQSLK